MLSSISAIYWVTGIIAILAGLCTALHALLNKREPSSALVWVSVCTFLPLIGALLYLLFGFNRIHRQASKLLLRSLKQNGPGSLSIPAVSDEEILEAIAKGLDKNTLLHLLVEKKHRDKKFYSKLPSAPNQVSEDMLPQDMRIMAGIGQAITGIPLLAGNKITPLFNGEEAYPEMLKAIENAQHTVWLTTYIFDNDKTGKSFTEALANAKARGVEVKVLVDGIGTFLTRPRIDKALKKRGISVERFIPPRIIPPQFSINLRNHRKLLLVDGKIAFTGGMNISDTHLVNKAKRKKLKGWLDKIKVNTYQDLHFKVEGVILGQLQFIFARDWLFATENEVLDLQPVSMQNIGYSFCRTILNGPDDFIDRLESILLGVISAAKNNIHIMTPYFLPQRPLINALQSASLRGVNVNIIIPSTNDQPIVKWACYNSLQELLSHGVRIFTQPPPFAHTKLTIIDNYYVHLGSANLDPRSLHLNFELTMEIFDLHFATSMNRHFLTVKEYSQEYTLDDLKARSLPIRIRDATAWMLSPYL